MERHQDMTERALCSSVCREVYVERLWHLEDGRDNGGGQPLLSKATLAE
jgi:hypothetical protein